MDESVHESQRWRRRIRRALQWWQTGGLECLYQRDLDCIIYWDTAVWNRYILNRYMHGTLLSFHIIPSSEFEMITMTWEVKINVRLGTFIQSELLILFITLYCIQYGCIIRNSFLNFTRHRKFWLDCGQSCWNANRCVANCTGSIGCVCPEKTVWNGTETRSTVLSL